MEAPTVNLPLGGQETIPATMQPILANKVMPSSRLNGAVGLTGSFPLASQEPPVIVREQDNLNLLNPKTALRARPQVGPEDQILCRVIAQASLSTRELEALARFLYFYVEQARLGGTTEWHALVDRLDNDPWLTSVVAVRLLQLDRDRLGSTDIAHLIGDPKKESSITKYRKNSSSKEGPDTSQQHPHAEAAEPSAPQDSTPKLDSQPDSAPSPPHPWADKATQMAGYETARKDFATLDTQWGDLYELLCELETLSVPDYPSLSFDSWPEMIVGAFAKDRDKGKPPEDIFNRLKNYVRDNYGIEI